MKYFLLLILIIFSLFITNQALAITNGMLASDVIGQYDGTSYTDPVGIFTKGGINDGPNIFGFASIEDTLIDSTNHRFFVADYGNNRVLIYNLNTDNTFPDKFPDYVLGQPDFYTNTANTTQIGMNRPIGLAYDNINNRLFVSEWLNKRVLIYNVTEITNGEPAVNVLGQVDFTSNIIETTQSSINNARYLAYDSINQRLFVAQPSTNRVTVFDVNEITNGEPAINVLGQVDFTSSVVAPATQTGMREPSGITFDSVNNRLFVGQNNGRRVTVYDVTEITNGEPAINVLGQTSFTANSSATSQIGGGVVYGVEYDSTNNRLFVGGSTTNRLLVYNVDPTVLISNNPATDGPNAINVLGQLDFTTITANTTQSGFYYPLNSTYDNINNKLYITDQSNSRIMIFDVSTIDNGENAVDLLGQYDGTSYTNPVPIYTKSGANNGPNVFGLSSPQDLFIDSVDHRLFETSNGRVLIYNLNENDILIDKIPDYILGQSNFYTNTSATVDNLNLSSVRGITYDYENKKLFVSDGGNHRILVYDLSDGITNGEPAVNVLGQIDFTHNGFVISATSLYFPYGLYYDSASKKLFVADRSNNRVVIYDLSDGITNGEPAVNVLGQVDFTHNTTATTQTGMNSPRSIFVIDQKLFVSEYVNNRILVYDLSDGITNGESAVNVLGQVDFTHGSASVDQIGMSAPMGIEYDISSKNLFVAESSNNRVSIFNISEISNGESAIAVLGQTDFTNNTANITKNGMTSPVGLFFDSNNNLLYVNEFGSHRATIFDLSITTITSVSAPSGTYQRGDTIPISVTFNKVINVTGTPTLTLETGDIDQIASYASGSGTDTLIFNYEVQREDEAESLDYTSTDALSLNDGTILDLYNGLPIFTLPIPGETGSLSNTSDVRVVIPRRSSGSYIQLTNLPQQSITPAVPEVPVVDNTITPITPSSELITKIENIKTVLRPNTISDDVKLIQIYLNTHGYPIALTGPGSQGYETNKYGKLTRQAVIKFQLANNLSPDGVVGPMTRIKMK